MPIAGVIASAHVESAGPVTLPAALLAYNFDQNGTSVLDQSGNGRDAVLLVGSTPTNLHSNGRLCLSASNQRLSYTPDAAALPSSASVTMKIATGAIAASENNLWTKMRVTNSSNFNLYIAGGTLAAVVRGTTVVGPSIIAPATGNIGPTLAANTTYQVALTYDGTITRMYLNGVETNTANTASGPLDMTGSDTTWSIGDAPLDTSVVPITQNFYVDDVRFFNVALTAAQVALAATTPVASMALFTEDWNTPDAANWDFFRWPHQRPFYPIVSKKGVFGVTGGSPRQAYADQYMTDFEMTVKMGWTVNVNGQYPEIAWRMFDGLASSSGTGYVIQVDGNGTRIDLLRVGAYSSIANVTDASLLAAGTRWFKIRVVGHNHKVKWWNDGSGEPGTWQIDVTDASPQVDTSGVPVTGGTIGFRTYGTNTITVDDLTVTDLGTPLGPDGSLRMLSHGKANIAGSSNVFNSDTDVSWCCWIRVTSYAGGVGSDIFSLFGGGSSYCSTAVLPSGELRQYMSTGDFATGYTVPLNTWVFVAMSRTMAAGTDLYYAPQGTPTLTKTHSASVGVVTGVPLYILSGIYGGGPYPMGAAFKIWKAALSQAELTTEMATYSAVRTTNLFASYPMRDGMDYRSENPVSGSLDLYYEQGGIVSGPKAPCT